MDTTNYIIQLTESPTTDYGRRDLSEQGPEQKVFTAVVGSSGSIFMDGFVLFFTNCDGECAHFAASAYRTIGAPKSADIIDRACAILSSEPIPEDSEMRAALVAALTPEAEDQLNELDQEMYSAREILDDLLFDYVKLHPDVFGPVPENVERVADKLAG